MKLSDEHISEFKELLEKKHGRQITDEEAQDSAYRLVHLFELLFDFAREDTKRKRRLKTEAEGFDLGGSYTCAVCHGSASWYSRWGITCLLCHRALKEGVLPGFVTQNRDSAYRMWELKHHFKLHRATAMKYVRDGKLTPRIVLTEDGKPHEYIFLKKENPALVWPFNPIRKSYDRNRKKISEVRTREEVRKWREEFAKLKKG
jgi:hypothetical protein